MVLGTAKRLIDILWLVFKGEIPDGHFVCHSCDNPACVNPEHLFIGTQQDNTDDRERKNRNNHFFGEHSPTSRLTQKDVIDIRQSNKSSRELARIYGVNKSSVQAIKNRETWKHVPQPPEVKE